MKKRIVALFVLTLVLAFSAALVGCGGSSNANKSESASSASTISSSASSEKDTSTAMVLKDGDAGEFGEIVTVNEGTDFENTDTAFSIPAGQYEAKNPSTTSAVQISFYSAEGFQDVDGHQERIMGTNSPVVLKAGEAKQIDIAEGDILVLSDGDCIELIALA